MKIETNLDRIPTELKSRPQWVGFKLQNGEKLPVIADRPNQYASINDPHTWRTFAIAANGLKAGKYKAIAYALDDDYIVVDLDDCSNGESLTPKAIADLLQSARVQAQTAKARRQSSPD